MGGAAPPASFPASPEPIEAHSQLVEVRPEVAGTEGWSPTFPLPQDSVSTACLLDATVCQALQ